MLSLVIRVITYGACGESGVIRTKSWSSFALDCFALFRSNIRSYICFKIFYNHLLLILSHLLGKIHYLGVCFYRYLPCKFASHENRFICFHLQLKKITILWITTFREVVQATVWEFGTDSSGFWFSRLFNEYIWEKNMYYSRFIVFIKGGG